MLLKPWEMENLLLSSKFWLYIRLWRILTFSSFVLFFFKLQIIVQFQTYLERLVSHKRKSRTKYFKKWIILEKSCAKKKLTWKVFFRIQREQELFLPIVWNFRQMKYNICVRGFCQTSDKCKRQSSIDLIPTNRFWLLFLRESETANKLFFHNCRGE